jgi:hypothetical protein
MPLYPTPNITSMTDLFNYTNNNMIYDVQGGGTGGMFGILLLFGLFMLIIISQKDTQPAGNAFALSGFITFVISVLLMAMGIMPGWGVGMFFALMLIGVILVWKGD